MLFRDGGFSRRKKIVFFPCLCYYSLHSSPFVFFVVFLFRYYCYYPLLFVSVRQHSLSFVIIRYNDLSFVIVRFHSFHSRVFVHVRRVYSAGDRNG